VPRRLIRGGALQRASNAYLVDIAEIDAVALADGGL
jgi:hypothetical protein